jgi:FixJ family two-component response regulator
MIAIIDYDDSVRGSTRALVRSLGYTAQTFASAEDFLSSDHRGKSNCIIADVQGKARGQRKRGGLIRWQPLEDSPRDRIAILLTASEWNRR